MGVAVRDYIPEGEAATPAEQSRMKRGKIIRTGANHDDFIPDPNDPTPKPHTSTAEERMDKAQKAASARAAWASDHAFEQAQLRLKDMTPAAVVDLMQTLPVASMELYYAAEWLGARRADILGMFPPVDPKVIDRYRKDPKPEEPKPSADALLQANEVSGEPDILVADVKAPADTQEAPETFLCLECEHEPFKSLAGLKSHQSAKHPD